MISIDYYFTAHKGETFTFIPVGDIHWGAVGCHETRLKEYVKWIKSDPNKYWFGMGDLIEAINISDKRFDERQVMPRYKDIYSNLIGEQSNDLCDVLSPIKDKALGGVYGNHEEKVRKVYHYDYHQHICEKLGMINLSGSAFLNLHFQRKNSSERKSVTLFIAHGNSAGDMPGGVANGLHRLLGKFSFEIGLFGHCHKKILMDEQLIAPLSATQRKIMKSGRMSRIPLKLGDIKYVKRLLGATGSFFQAYPSSGTTPRTQVTTYGENKVFSPASLGCIQIHITPFKYAGQRGFTKMDYHMGL